MSSGPAARGDFDRAAVLVRFAEAGIERAGGEWPPDERRQHEGTLETLRAGLASDALGRARAAGPAMSTAEGLEYALSAPAPGRIRGLTASISQSACGTSRSSLTSITASRPSPTGCWS